MHDVDPKVLAKLIKAEKKGKLMWQKEDSPRAKFELISNGRWTVVSEEITDPVVRVALFSIFDCIIEPGQAIEMAYGEIKRDEENYMKELHYAPHLATSAMNISTLQIGAGGNHPDAQFIYDMDILMAVSPEYAALTWGRIAHREPGEVYAPIYLGEEKEIMVVPVWPHTEKTWPEIIKKVCGVDINKQSPNPATSEIDMELYNEVREYVVETRQCSVAAIQRKFRLGYAAAARLVDMLERFGVVGPFEGSTPRKVLVTE